MGSMLGQQPVVRSWLCHNPHCALCMRFLLGSSCSSPCVRDHELLKVPTNPESEQCNRRAVVGGGRNGDTWQGIVQVSSLLKNCYAIRFAGQGIYRRHRWQLSGRFPTQSAMVVAGTLRRCYWGNILVLSSRHQLSSICRATNECVKRLASSSYIT